MCVGCTRNQVTFVPPGIPVRLGEDIKDVSVYVKHETEGLIEAKADLLKGMWIIVDPEEWSIEHRTEIMNIERR